MWDSILELFGSVARGSMLWLGIIFLAAVLTEVAFPGACPFLEVFLILTGFKIAQGTQPPAVVPFLATVYTGRVCGSTGLYWLSAFSGGKLGKRLVKHVRANEIWVRWLKWKLKKFTLPILLIARFTPGFGIASTVTSGISRVEYKKFFAALTAHVIAWEAIFLGVGALGAGVSQLVSSLSNPLFLIIWVGVTIILGAVLALIFIHRTRARLQLALPKAQAPQGKI